MPDRTKLFSDVIRGHSMSYLDAYVALVNAYEQHAGNYQLLAEIAQQELRQLDREGVIFLQAKLLQFMSQATTEDKKAFYANILSDIDKAGEE
jgi:hypothetical protein